MGYFKLINKETLQQSDHLKDHVACLRAAGAQEVDLHESKCFYFETLPQPFTQYKKEWIEGNCPSKEET